MGLHDDDLAHQSSYFKFQRLDEVLSSLVKNDALRSKMPKPCAVRSKSIFAGCRLNFECAIRCCFHSNVRMIRLP